MTPSVQKPIRYIISRESKPSGIGLQSAQFAVLFRPWLDLHTIRRWETTIRGKPRFGFLSFALNRLAPVKKTRGQILHASDFGLIPHIADPMDVTEVWDLIPFKRLWEHQERLFKSAYYCSFIPGLVRSRSLVTHTEAVRRDVLTYCDRESTVIPGGVSTDVFRILPDVRKEERSVLFVSGFYAHKNNRRVVDALGIVSETEGPVHLRVVGPRAHEVAAGLREAAGPYPLLNLEPLGNVSTKGLVELYNLSSIYCSASFEEGFGLTPVEAMACGTRPVLSDIPVHREVVGDLGTYFNPHDVHDMARVLGVTLGDGFAYPRGWLRFRALDFDWKEVVVAWRTFYGERFGIHIPLFPFEFAEVDA